MTRATTPTPSLFRQRVDEFIRLIDRRPASDFALPEIQQLARQVLRALAVWVPIAEFEARLVARATVDTGSLDQTLDILEAARLPGFRTISPQELIGRLRQLSTTLHEHGHRFPETEVLLRLEFPGSGWLENVLMCAPLDSDLSGVLVLARAKLHLVDEISLASIWDATRREVQIDDSRESRDDERARLILTGADHDLMKPTFFDTVQPTEIRRRLAEYLVRLRPQLIRRRLEQGQQRFPIPPLGLARVLVISKKGTDPSLSETETALARSTSRLVALIAAQRPDFLREAAELLSVPIDGYLLAGPEAQGATKHVSGIANEAVVLFEMSALLWAADALVTARSPLELLLLQHKLSLELSDKVELAKLAGESELTLQRRLSRYLIDHGVFAVGTLFGRSETDLVVDEGVEVFVIEAKKYKSGTKAPTVADMHAHLTQLESYVDQQTKVARHSALVIYNFSETLLVAPRIRIGGRYSVVFVNLMAASPSKRKQSRIFSIFEGQLVATDHQPAPKTPARKKSSAGLEPKKAVKKKV